MTVDQLRETLAQLLHLLRAADAKKATTDGLADFIEATAAFKGATLTAFVGWAEAGRNPVAKAAPAVRGEKKTGVDPAAVTAEVKNLYDRAAEPNVTEAQIRAACERLNGLKKEALVLTAEGIGLVGMKSKKKDELVGEITRRLTERKGDAIRRQLVDRPGGNVTTPAHDSGNTDPPPQAPG